MNYSEIRFLTKQIELLPELTNYINYLYYKSDKFKIALGKNSAIIVRNGIGYSHNIYKDRVKQLNQDNIKSIKFWDNNLMVLLTNGIFRNYNGTAVFFNNIKEFHCRDNYLVLRTYDDQLIFKSYNDAILEQDSDDSNIIESAIWVNKSWNIKLKIKYDQIYCTNNIFTVRSLDKKVYSIGLKSKLLTEDVNDFAICEYPGNFHFIKDFTFDGDRRFIKHTFGPDRVVFLDDQLNCHILIGLSKDNSQHYQFEKKIKTFRYINNRILILNLDNTVELYDDNGNLIKIFDF